jgi:hypothetical protein
MKKIEKVTGVANNVRVNGTVQEVGNNGIQTMYLCTFSIKNQKMQFRANVPVFIDENDELEVAGWLEDGVFMVSAYKNISQELNEYGSYGAKMGGGAVFFIAGIAGSFASPYFANIMFCGLFVVLGFFLMTNASDGLKAVRLLK